MAVLSIGQVWATDEQVAIFESSTVVTASSYAAYANDDWSLSKGGNNVSCGFNKSNKTEIGNAYGTSATTTDHGYTIVSVNNLEDVYKITFTYTAVASGNKGTPTLYLGYSTDDGANWNAISLATGAGLSAQGVTTSAGTTYTFQFTKIASARYAIVHSASQQLTGNNDTFRFDNVTATFYKESGDVIVKTLKSIAVTGMTTSYEVGDAFSFDGTCTATYSVTKNGVPQDDEEDVVTPTEVTDPDMTSAGDQTITVTYTESEVTKTTTYDITVSTALPKITIDGTATGITTTDETQSITAGDGSFGGIFKQYSTTALWFTKGSGFIYNKESFGKIRKITINYKSGGSTDAVQWLRLGNAALNSFSSETTNGTEFTTSSPTSPNTFVVTGDFEYFCLSVSSSKNLQVTSIVIAYEADASAPSVTIDPTSISLATPDAASGTIEATYTNVTLASVTVGRFNDAECTEAFTGDWLTATFNGDKDIDYTIAANTGAARTAYIKLTAPASNGTSPDVVKVIAVSQAQAIPTYTALDAIFTAATNSDVTVKVTFNNWVISAVNGDNAYLTDNTYGLIIYTSGHGFNVGDVLSGTVQTTLTKFRGNAELKGVKSDSEGLSVTTGGTITPRVVGDPTTLTGANAGSVITINGSCTVASTKYYINGVQLFNTLYTFDALTDGDQYNCTGVFVMYNTTKEILPRSAADIEEIAVPTAVITLADVVLEKGQNTTLSATVTPPVAASAEVTYSILDGDSYVSLVGAVLTANEIGTAHIRATVADNLPNYKGATKDITVTVNPVDSRKTAQDIDGFEAISGALNADISFEAKKGNANNTPIVPSGKDYIRIYQNGGYLAVNAVKGCTIDEVIITIPSGCNSTTIAVGTDEDNLPTTGGSAATAGSSFTTGTGLNSQNVYLVCLGTTSSTRLEFGTIVVKYTGEPATVTGLALGGTYQTEFEVDDTFNHTGIVVTATYSDASEEDVTALANFSTPDMSAAGTKEITVSFGGQSTSYNIEVVTATLDHIELSGDYPTSFAQGASFSHAGMTVTAVYSDYSEVDVTADATFSGYSMSGAGVQTVTVAYGGKEATYKITVVPANTDVITASGIGAEGSGYADWSAKSFNTSAVYAGHSYAPNTDAIQIRTSQSKEGIVVTTQNETKVVKSVVVNFATEPTNPRVLQVYGKHSVYTSAADLFDTEKQGTLIGTLAASGTLDCTAADYEYIGLRSSEGAMYLACVMVEWGDATPEPPTPVYTEVRTDLTPNAYYTMCLDKAVASVKAGSIWKVLSKAQNGTDIILEEVTATEAGRPYIIYATETTFEVEYTGDAVGAPVNDAANNGLIGSFSKASIAENAGNYIIYNNALYVVNSDNVFVGDHRAYLHMDDVPDYSGANLAPGRRRVTMAVHGPQTATGIEDLNASEKPMKMMINGQIFILRGEKMYDTTGRLVK